MGTGFPVNISTVQFFARSQQIHCAHGELERKLCRERVTTVLLSNTRRMSWIEHVMHFHTLHAFAGHYAVCTSIK